MTPYIHAFFRFAVVVVCIWMLFLSVLFFSPGLTSGDGEESNDLACRGITPLFLILSAMPESFGGTGDPISTVRALQLCATEYKLQHPYFVIILYALTYVSMQTCNIPGTPILVMLAGALYNFHEAILLAGVSSTLAATCSYLVSKNVAIGMMEHYFPERVKDFRDRIHRNRQNLFNYLLFLRLTPLVPSMVVNYASPVVGVPLDVYIGATTLGQLFPNAMHIFTGQTIATLEELTPQRSFMQACAFILLGLPLLLPSKKEEEDCKKKSN